MPPPAPATASLAPAPQSSGADVYEAVGLDLQCDPETRWRLATVLRLARSLTLTAKGNAVVEGAIAVRAKDQHIVARHILSNIFAPMIVQLPLLIPAGIMTIASVTFLGLGVRPPTAKWASMLKGSLQWYRMAPHVMILPSPAVILVALGCNTMGDEFRVALDSRTQGK